MTDSQRNIILACTGATELGPAEHIQSLWSGYGSILRYPLVGCDRTSLVVKHVRVPNAPGHPRGWNTDISHQRKLRSYQVEPTWYQQFAPRCTADCRVPICFAVESADDQVFMVLEDLDAAGFSQRRERASAQDIELCLRWLASFHATFLAQSPDGLWEQGTYWHLATRPEELEALDDLALKQAAAAIDQLLARCRFRTLVHGDAKLANFCFHNDAAAVAAVDFQYVGGGCGMQDVAYFVSSCLCENECERQEESLLDSYFAALRMAVCHRISGAEFAALEQEWRALYPVAWTDFFRFLQGWSPSHWKIHRYSQRLTREVLASLK